MNEQKTKQNKTKGVWKELTHALRNRLQKLMIIILNVNRLIFLAFFFIAVVLLSHSCIIHCIIFQVGCHFRGYKWRESRIHKKYLYKLSIRETFLKLIHREKKTEKKESKEMKPKTKRWRKNALGHQNVVSPLLCD